MDKEKAKKIELIRAKTIYSFNPERPFATKAYEAYNKLVEAFNVMVSHIDAGMKEDEKKIQDEANAWVEAVGFTASAHSNILENGDDSPWDNEFYVTVCMNADIPEHLAPYIQNNHTSKFGVFSIVDGVFVSRHKNGFYSNFDRINGSRLTAIEITGLLEDNLIPETMLKCIPGQYGLGSG